MNSSNTPVIELGGKLTVPAIWKWMKQPYTIELSPDTIQAVEHCRATLEKINAREEPVYGVSTGFGHLENKWIPPDKQGELQINLIRSHAIGTGEQVPVRVTRVAMLLLINSLSQGHSGIALQTLERLIFYLNHDIIPVTYSIGSLGASGDLAPLAHLALPLIGEGEVWYQGELMPTGKVLEQLELQPVELAAKEGLALINGTHFITAYALVLMTDIRETLLLSAVGASLSLEALRGTDTPFNTAIASLRPHPGHKVMATIHRKILNGSKIIESHKDPRIDHKTQDAYAFRCIPQVMGGVWDALRYLEQTVAIEINAITDNPLIFPEEGSIYSGGNFHAEPLGFPLETVCMAMVEVGNITEARISRLVSPFTPELPAFLAKKPGVESGYMIAHYTVAALLNKLRGLAHPNITDNIPVSGNQEDHVSMVMTTATRAHEIFGIMREIVTFEIMMAIRGLNLVDHPPSSPILEEIITQINENIQFEERDHIIHNTLEEFKDYLGRGEVVDILEKNLDIPGTFSSSTGV